MMQKEFIALLNKVTTKAVENPGKVVKLYAGCYYKYDATLKTLYNIHRSYEPKVWLVIKNKNEGIWTTPDDTYYSFKEALASLA
jgi:hypothetical protein